MLGLAKRVKAKILQAFTSEVYGDPEEHPQREGYWGHVNPIGARLLRRRQAVRRDTVLRLRRQHGLDTKVVRIFNTYGPRTHLNGGRVVSNFIAQALRGKDITIHGDGWQTRSFCCVDDLMEGLVRVMAAPLKVSGPVNLGNPIELTIRELAESVLTMVGERSELAFKSLPQDDPRQRKPDISLAQQTPEWQPSVPLKEGLATTIGYFRELLTGR